MARSYRQITPDLASQLRLVITDVDGTLTSIAENGGVAKLKAHGELVDLGYSRQSALKIRFGHGDSLVCWRRG